MTGFDKLILAIIFIVVMLGSGYLVVMALQSNLWPWIVGVFTGAACFAILELMVID